jgi:hypothetical protein
MFLYIFGTLDLDDGSTQRTYLLEVSTQQLVASSRPILSIRDGSKPVIGNLLEDYRELGDPIYLIKMLHQ